MNPACVAFARRVVRAAGNTSAASYCERFPSSSENFASFANGCAFCAVVAVLLLRLLVASAFATSAANSLHQTLFAPNNACIDLQERRWSKIAFYCLLNPLQKVAKRNLIIRSGPLRCFADPCCFDAADNASESESERKTAAAAGAEETKADGAAAVAALSDLAKPAPLLRLFTQVPTALLMDESTWFLPSRLLVWSVSKLRQNRVPSAFTLLVGT
jgi:hypothetical protein